MSKPRKWELRSNLLLAEISEMSPDAQTIKLADRLANVRDAKRSKSGERWARYLRQTEAILKIVPRRINPALWDAIKGEL